MSLKDRFSDVLFAVECGADALDARYAALSERTRATIRISFLSAMLVGAGAFLKWSLDMYEESGQAAAEAKAMTERTEERIREAIAQTNRLYGIDMDPEVVLAADNPGAELEPEFQRALGRKADSLVEALKANPEMKQIILGEREPLMKIKDHVENPTQVPIPGRK